MNPSAPAADALIVDRATEEVVEMVHIGRSRLAAGKPQRRRGAWWTVYALLAGSAAVALAACGGSPGSGAAAGAASPAGQAAASSQAAASGQAAAASTSATDHISLIGEIDATSGAPGTFTGKPGWPKLAPSEIHVPAGATVVLTIKEYDDMVTPLPSGSPYNTVMGGTETVNGKPVTTVSNKQIAHTFTVPGLNINVPLPKAPHGGFTTVQFTFTAPATAGTYQWQCMTPCGTGKTGTSGAMKTDGWMRGHLIVS